MEEVTFIVNTYNRKEKLLDALTSIFEQEIDIINAIVIDDCSDVDIGHELLEKFGSRLYFHRNEKNLGLAKSRQIGLELAKTEFIAFLDDDDILIDKQKTKRHLSKLKKDDRIAVVCSNVLFKKGNELEPSNIKFPNDLYKFLLKRNGIIYPSTTTVRREYMLKCGGFDSKFPRGIDSDVYRRLLKESYLIDFDKKATIEYLIESDDKITNYDSYNGIKKDVISNSLVIIKYFPDIIFNSDALMFRTRKIISGLLRMTKSKFS